MIKKMIVVLLLCPLLAWAQTNPKVALIAPYDMSRYDAALSIWWQQKAAKSSDLTQRLEGASAWLLGKPYELFPTGEGPTGAIDQGPLYRTDKFDCTTYVVTVIALAESQNLTTFIPRYQALMYQDGQVDFFHRNHFASEDFNANNEATGALTNITPDIKDKVGKTLAKTISVDINKPAWYQKTGLQRVRLLQPPTPTEWTHINELLQHYQKTSQDKQASVDYIPLPAMINASGEVNAKVLKQIPQGSIWEVVYFNPHDVAHVGTNLLIAHMGFVFNTPQGAIFREASSLHGKVVDVPLNVELRQMQLDPTILGVHLEAIN